VKQGAEIDALLKFHNMLQGLADDPTNKFQLVNTQGTLVADEWANELHPVPSGFLKMSQKFQAALKKAFPTRI
jgi:hypothetical protein